MEELKAATEIVLTKDGWPFWAAALIFTVIGQFTATKLFTRDQAYAKTKPAFLQHFWWWGRETLMLHPIASGVMLGAQWPDPQNLGWTLPIISKMYFGAAGVVSLVAFAAIKGFLKKRGINIELPGV